MCFFSVVSKKFGSKINVLPVINCHFCPAEPCVCSAWGDPHFTTCDGQKFDYMGKCVYVTAETCRGDGPMFRIEERHQPYKYNKRAATTEAIYIHLDKNGDGETDLVRLLYFISELSKKHVVFMISVLVQF